MSRPHCQPAGRRVGDDLLPRGFEIRADVGGYPRPIRQKKMHGEKQEDRPRAESGQPFAGPQEVLRHVVDDRSQRQLRALHAQIHGAEEVLALPQDFERHQSRLLVQRKEHVLGLPFLEPQRDEIASLGQASRETSIARARAPLRPRHAFRPVPKARPPSCSILRSCTTTLRCGLRTVDLYSASTTIAISSPAMNAANWPPPSANSALTIRPSSVPNAACPEP